MTGLTNRSPSLERHSPAWPEATGGSLDLSLVVLGNIEKDKSIRDDLINLFWGVTVLDDEPFEFLKHRHVRD